MEYINLKKQYERISEDLRSRLNCVLENADFIMGDSVKRFEGEMAAYVGVKYTIACASGTDALQLIFMAYDIGPGDAVFCPDMTFIASVEPACLLGATPVFCEICEDTYNIQPKSLERQIKRVIEQGKLIPKAIVAVDYLGNPADYDELQPIADRYNLLMIEDAAQSIGASYHGKKCGSLGNIAATSFFPSKPLGCYGDGGAVFTNDEHIWEKISSLHIHGKGKSKYDNIRIGINSRLDTIQAEILLAKLRILDDEIQTRQHLAKIYDRELNPIVKIPTITLDATSAYAQYVIQLKPEDDCLDFRGYLMQNHIPNISYYPNPLHLLPVFEGIDTYGENFDFSVRHGRCNVGIPFSPYLSENEQQYVIEQIKKYFQEARK